MKLLFLAITFLSLSLSAQELNINLERQEVELINPNLQEIELNVNELREELQKYKDLLKEIDNIQLRDGRVIDIRDINLPNSTRTINHSGTGGGG